MRSEVAPAGTDPDPQAGGVVYLVSVHTEQFAEWLSAAVMIEDAGSAEADDAAALAKAVEFAGRFAAEAKRA